MFNICDCFVILAPLGNVKNTYEEVLISLKLQIVSQPINLLKVAPSPPAFNTL